jgi:hypothetical protein
MSACNNTGRSVQSRVDVSFERARQLLLTRHASWTHHRGAGQFMLRSPCGLRGGGEPSRRPQRSGNDETCQRCLTKSHHHEYQFLILHLTNRSCAITATHELNHPDHHNRERAGQLECWYCNPSSQLSKTLCIGDRLDRDRA